MNLAVCGTTETHLVLVLFNKLLNSFCNSTRVQINGSSDSLGRRLPDRARPVSQERYQHGQELLLRHIQSILFPGVVSQLLTALITVMNSDPERRRKFELGEVQRLRGKVSTQSTPSSKHGSRDPTHLDGLHTRKAHASLLGQSTIEQRVDLLSRGVVLDRLSHISQGSCCCPAQSRVTDERRKQITNHRVSRKSRFGACLRASDRQAGYS